MVDYDLVIQRRKYIVTEDQIADDDPWKPYVKCHYCGSMVPELLSYEQINPTTQKLVYICELCSYG